MTVLDMLPANTTPFTDQAACLHHDPEKWFPISYSHDHKPHIPASVDVTGCQVCDPIRICRNQCPLTLACLDYRMRTEGKAKSDRYGIWGGTTPSQRDALHRRNPERWK